MTGAAARADKRWPGLPASSDKNSSLGLGGPAGFVPEPVENQRLRSARHAS